MKTFKELVKENKPLQILGAINAYCAMLAEYAGAKALYLSGAGVANAAYGMPDLGMTNLKEVAEEARRITDTSSLPLLVDVDTGWGHVFNIARTIKTLEKAGVAAIHIEDQIAAKRCGHRPNKSIVSKEEMGDRIKACVDARTKSDFIIMARTDAFAKEGLQSSIERSLYYIEKGADMIFIEALPKLELFKEFCQNVKVPVLVNITEFGETPILTVDELHSVGVSMVLYPLSIFRLMSKVALDGYQTIIKEGSQKSLIHKMQTRKELYEVLQYEKYEHILDQYNKES